MKKIAALLIALFIMMTSIGSVLALPDYTVDIDKTVYNSGDYMCINITSIPNIWYTIEILNGGDVLMSYTKLGDVIDLQIKIPYNWEDGENYTLRAGIGTIFASVNFEVNQLDFPIKVLPVTASPPESIVSAGTMITLSTLTQDAEIYYTLDNSTPTKSSTLYIDGIMINTTTTLKAIAVKDRYEDSDILTQTYTVITGGGDNGGGDNGGGDNGGGDNGGGDNGGGDNGGGGSTGGGSTGGNSGGGIENINELWINPFTDVKESDWFYNDVEYAFKNGLMAGTSTEPMMFSPNMALSRAMAVTVLSHIDRDADLSVYEPIFDDVGENKWYFSAVNWAAANGIVSGYGNGRFGAEDSITREQMAVILINYENFTGNIPPAVFEEKVFADQNDISFWAVGAVSQLTSQGIISGKPGDLFDPKGKATRAEFAAMLRKFLQMHLETLGTGDLVRGF